MEGGWGRDEIWAIGEGVARRTAVERATRGATRGG